MKVFNDLSAGEVMSIFDELSAARKEIERLKAQWLTNVEMTNKAAAEQKRAEQAEDRLAKVVEAAKQGEDLGEGICVSCGGLTLLREGCEPTPECDDCAQGILERVRAALASAQPKAVPENWDECPCRNWTDAEKCPQHCAAAQPEEPCTCDRFSTMELAAGDMCPACAKHASAQTEEKR